MLLAGVMGFSSGLPILLSLSVLQAWLTVEGVDLATIGFLGLVALPYNLKFAWAPVIDRFDPLGLGRRKSWLAIAQVCVAISLFILGTRDPSQTMWAVAIAAVLVTFFSATQDIVIDAYRRESVADDEQGLSASMSIYGYRFGTLLASAGGLILADWIGFSGVYIFMAAVVLSMVVVTLFAPEPEASLSRPGNLRAAFVEPFTELFQRHETARTALLILLFVFVYNLGMQLSGHMAIPFYLAVGFTNTDIGAVSAIFGVAPFLRLRRRAAYSTPSGHERPHETLEYRRDLVKSEQGIGGRAGGRGLAVCAFPSDPGPAAPRRSGPQGNSTGELRSRPHGNA